jgi:hypothetical protein
VGEKIVQTAVLSYIFIYIQTKHSGDDRQLSPLTRTLGIPCLIFGIPSVLGIYGMYLRLILSTTPDLKF